MANDERVNEVDHEKAEAEAAAALDRSGGQRATMPAKEFVSERDALEDAWATSRDRGSRDEGW